MEYFRDDHVIFRQLTRSPGFIQVCPDRLDGYLMPSLDLAAAQRSRIEDFLRICEHRFVSTFRTDCLPVRFHFIRDPSLLIKKLFNQKLS